MKILHDERNNNLQVTRKRIFNLYICVSQIWLLSIVSIITCDQVMRSTDSRLCSTLRYLHCGVDLTDIPFLGWISGMFFLFSILLVERCMMIPKH